MADSILRLKVESQEYDNKLKQATNGLTRYVEECRKVGGTLEVVEKETLDYVRAMGNMETTAKNATGKLSEMKKAFTEWSVVYKNMTDQEKASPVGKALAESLDALKGRIAESKGQLDDINKSINGSGGLSGALNAVAGQFGLSIEQVTKFGGVVGVATTALNVAKDAFFNNEEQLDEWGRVVESSHSLYTGFLNALNTGDISGYLSNINQIVQAARDAYDALDNLGTYNAFNQINVERTRTNMTESIADYRGGKGSKDAVKAAGEAYKKELQDRKRLENEAYLAAVKRVAAERGISAKDLTDALSGTYGHYQDLKNVQPTGVRQTVVGAGMFARTGTETFAQTRQEKLGEALRHLNDTELQSLQALGAQAQRTGNEIAQVDKQLTRVLNGRQPGETGVSGGATTTGSRRGGATGGFDVSNIAFDPNKAFLAAVKSADTGPSEIWKALVERNKQSQTGGGRGLLDALIAYNKAEGISPSDNEEKKSKGDRDMLKSGRDLLNGVSQLTDGLSKIGIEIPSEIQSVIGVIQGVMQVIEAVNTIIGVTQTTALTSNTAAIISLEAAMWANTASSWLPFANGGIVPNFAAGGLIGKAVDGMLIPGNSYSGDNLRMPVVGGGMIGVNSGELILNHAQQNAVANELQSGARAISVTGRLRGSDIVLSIDRELQQSGRGQLLTWG